MLTIVLLINRVAWRFKVEDIHPCPCDPATSFYHFDRVLLHHARGAVQVLRQGRVQSGTRDWTDRSSHLNAVWEGALSM